MARATVAAGIQPGDHVSIWAPNLPEFEIALIGAQCRQRPGGLRQANRQVAANGIGYLLRLWGTQRDETERQAQLHALTERELRSELEKLRAELPETSHK